MNFKATIQLALLSIFIITASLCFSQEKKESIPVVIVEGIVKLKGKPVNNATLILNKDGKQVAKLITPRNGIYHFELNKSNTNPQNIYKIEIVKEGTVNGRLTINTYIPPEQFTTVPYLYNLDFTLISSDAANGVNKKDYGLIHWFTDKKVFDFDKDYVPPVEVDPIAENLAKKADSIKTAEETKALLAEKAAAEEKRKADSLLAATIKKPDGSTQTTTNKENATANTTKTKDGKNKSENSTAISSKTNNTKTNEKQTSSNKDKTNTTATVSKSQQSTGANSKTSASTNSISNTTSKVGNTSNTSGSMVTSNEQSEAVGQNTGNASVAENTQAEPQSPKDLFFLTGVPMEQFKRNVNTDNSRDYDNFYSTEELMFANNEHNRLLSLKEKMARKRAENSAKKLETNNTLTSLLDEVTEFEKRNKQQKK